jgi:hypothetical protein
VGGELDGMSGRLKRLSGYSKKNELIRSGSGMITITSS